jgi:uncharacterized protein (DUF1800 family)
MHPKQSARQLPLALVLCSIFAISPLAASAATTDRLDAVNSLELQITGTALTTTLGEGLSVPASATAASLNITVVNPEAEGYLTVWPCGPRPLASSLNFSRGQVVPNGIIAPLSAEGSVCLFSNAATDVIVDVAGWFDGNAFSGAMPQRLVDTRNGTGGMLAKVEPSRPLAFPVTEQAVTSSLGAAAQSPRSMAAAALNVTVVNPEGDGYLTVWPCGSARPNASNINFTPGAVLANGVVAPAGSDGRVCVYSSAPTDVIVDLVGWFPDQSFEGLTPTRLTDTRTAGKGAKLSSDGVLALPLRGEALLSGPSVPDSAKAIALNVTVTGAEGPGYLTLWPCGSSRPLSSNLNYSAGQTVANNVIAPLGNGDQLCIYASATTHVIVDLAGWVKADTAQSAFIGTQPQRLGDTRFGLWQAGGAGSELPETKRVLVRATGEGSIQAPSSLTVPAGDQVLLTLAPDPGSFVAEATGCSGTLTNNVYRTGEIGVSCQVSVVFALTEEESALRAQEDAYRLLNQATMGAQPREAKRLAGAGSGALEAWIDEQLLLPPSELVPYIVDSILAPDFEPCHAPFADNPDFVFNDDQQCYRLYGWIDHALNAEDQLRRRTAWALSQIFVVSDQGALFEQVMSVADFYDTLSRNAFANYRDLLKAVTLHPAMGVYLSMLGNRRAEEGTNLRPDENYAREVMQLFSIGQVLLNDDGSTLRDSNGIPIPSYNQATISGFARAFTGWSYRCSHGGCGSIDETSPDIPNDLSQLRNWGQGYISNLTRPMALYAHAHEPGTKQLLDYPGVKYPGGLVPAGLGGEQDLEEALDNIFYHPNVPPFISRVLIQKLVTSNPSPSYVSRISTVFKDNGKGIRGDLGAVIKAILLDPEARRREDTTTAGKLKEPLLRVLHLWRAMDAYTPSGRTNTDSFCCPVYGSSPLHIFGQSPGQAMSVFNFFSPSYRPPGELFDGVLGPELQIATENLHIQMGWFFNVQAMARTSEQEGDQGADSFYIRIDDEMAEAHSDELLVDMLGEKLLGSSRLISPVLRQEIYSMLSLWPQVTKEGNSREDRMWKQRRVSEAISMILLSPDFAVQR